MSETSTIRRTAFRTNRRSGNLRPQSGECDVLCIDDDDDLTRIVKARMRQHGIDVVRSSNGRDGLKLARRYHPKVIITDLGMAGGHGEYLIRRLKGRASTASIPIFVISGLADDARVASAHLLQVQAVLRKPIQFDVLFEELSPFLNDKVKSDRCSTIGESSESSADSPRRRNAIRQLTYRIDAGSLKFKPHT